MYILGVPPAVDDEDEQHVGRQDPDGEHQHDERLQHITGPQHRQEARLAVPRVRTANILQSWRHKNRRFVMHLAPSPTCRTDLLLPTLVVVDALALQPPL